MQELFHGKVKEFIGGSIVGFIAGIKFLFAGPLSPGGLVIEYFLKFIAVCIFSFTSGLFTILAKELMEGLVIPYLRRKFPKFFKKKPDDNK